MDSIQLTKLSKSAGCAAKLSPNILAEVVSVLPKFSSENLLVGVETADDAAVYKINEETALIQTLDFFPPMVDDPYTFGQVAAANALSDIYAMGGEPALALNIVAFPNCLGSEILSQILAGGADKVKEAGAVLAGGHSINDEEPKYGLSVTGFVHPDKIWKNKGAKPGDVLLLTKPLGVGIINTAIKLEKACQKARDLAILNMTTLNKQAKEILQKYDIHSCTDVTGFGIAGHSLEMALASEVTIEIDVKDLPVLSYVKEYAEKDYIPSGMYRNKKYHQECIKLHESVDKVSEAIVFDPQTSGGLLISVDQSKAAEIIHNFKNKEYPFEVCIVGKVAEKQVHSLIIK